MRFDLEVHAWEHGGEIELYWLYNRDLFDRWRIEQMSRQYVRLLEAVAANPEQRIGEIDLLDDAERRQILEEWNDTAQEVADATLPELFEAQVEKTPDAVAVVFEDQRLSYRELNQRANQLAHMLISRGVGPEEVVGICLERSLEMVVGLLGVLKAGAAYLPLDPDYPKERLAFMLQDAEPVCVVTTERTQRCLPDNPTRILLENLGTVEQQGKTHNPHNGDRTRPLFLHNPAYVIYTSGSTGRPKGVVVTHGGL